MNKINGLKEIFSQNYGHDSRPLHCFFAPGRVNLIGEYTDFNGGYVFPAALSLGIYGMLKFRQDKLIQLKSTNNPLPVRVDLEKSISYQQEDGWGNYPKGVIKYLLERGYSLKGCDIMFSGDLPDGAGLSSSAAILVLTAYMLCYANGDRQIDRTVLAKLCQEVENRFIKVNCGIMDQFSVAVGRKDHAILLDCETLHYKYIPFILEKQRLIIMNSNKKRELTDSKYNERRSECDQALAIIQGHRPIANLCQASLTEVEEYLQDDILRRRARHAVSENNRVLRAVNLLEQGDIPGFASLMTQSHLSLKNDFEVSGPELDCLVDNALRAAGCLGARMTGAGFGGCAIALVENDKLEDFQVNVAKGYKKGTGLTAEFYLAGIYDGVKVL